MTAANYDNSIRRTLKWEGGYVNHPADPGGETNWGITIKVARDNGYTGPMKTMPLAVAMDIYRRRYAKPVGFDAHRAGVDYSLLDYGVNSGVSRANKVARRVCGLPDAAPMADLLNSINRRDPKAVVKAINDERIKFLMALPTWGTFGKGWSNRVNGVRVAALQMAGAVAAEPEIIEPAPGKGEVKKPNTTKVIVATETGKAAGGGFGFADWISAHPFYSVLIFIASLVVTVTLIEFVAHKIRAAKQDAPTPGIVPVPELEH